MTQRAMTEELLADKQDTAVLQMMLTACLFYCNVCTKMWRGGSCSKWAISKGGGM